MCCSLPRASGLGKPRHLLAVYTADLSGRLQSSIILILILKGSELSAAAEMNARDFNQKTEIHGCQLEITEKEMRAQQYQYEARVMAEAMGTLENTMDGIHRQAKEEEQQQLKDANLALTEANKVLKRENLLRTPAFDGREGAEVKEQIQELEQNLQETGKELRETRWENAQMKQSFVMTKRTPNVVGTAVVMDEGYQPVGQTTKRVHV